MLANKTPKKATMEQHPHLDFRSAPPGRAALASPGLPSLPKLDKSTKENRNIKQCINRDIVKDLLCQQIRDRNS